MAMSENDSSRDVARETKRPATHHIDQNPCGSVVRRTSNGDGCCLEQKFRRGFVVYDSRLVPPFKAYDAMTRRHGILSQSHHFESPSIHNN
jgi:hypothetical protein